MWYLLLVVGAVTAYEIAAKISRLNHRYKGLNDDARMNRIRVLNQTGDDHEGY